MAIKGILFDFNGTLFFDSEFHMEAFRQIFPAYGKPVPSDEYMIQKIFGCNNKTIYEENIDPLGTPEDVREFADKKESIYRELCLANPQDFHLTPGACDLLDHLKATGIPYCVATGSAIDNVSFYFEHMGLGRWFSLDNIIYTDGSFGMLLEASDNYKEKQLSFDAAKAFFISPTLLIYTILTISTVVIQMLLAFIMR